MLLAIIGIILAALAAGAFIYVAVKLTTSFLKKYRKKKNTKIMAALLKDLFKDAPIKKLDDLPDEDEESVVLAEYDEEEDELVRDPEIYRDVDDRMRKILDDSGGIVIFE